MTTAGTIVDVYHYARQRNLPCDELAAIATPLDDRLDERVPCARFIEALEAAVRCTGDEDFGLHFAEDVPIERLDLLVYLVASASNLTAGIRQAERFLSLRDESVEMRLVLDTAEPRWIASPTYIGLPRDRLGVIQHTINLLAVSLHVARELTGVAFAPRCVRFAAPRPRDTAELERFFRTELHFDAPISEMTMSCEVLSLPMRKADPGLLAVLTRHAEDVMARFPSAPDTWTHQIRRLLLESVCAGEMDLAIVAKQFAVTPRTLQRRLRDEGTSFQALLDEARRELSMRYLRDPRRTTGEVAYLLGFQEISAFYRAFKRWTGLTPAAFRRQAG